MSISYSDGGIPQEHGHKTKTKTGSWEKAYFKVSRRATEASLQLCEHENIQQAVIKDLGEIYTPLL